MNDTRDGGAAASAPAVDTSAEAVAERLAIWREHARIYGARFADSDGNVGALYLDEACDLIDALAARPALTADEARRLVDEFAHACHDRTWAAAHERDRGEWIVASANRNTARAALLAALGVEGGVS